MSEETGITPRQVRTARALLAWSQKELAEKANLGQSTIADFEREHRVPAATSAEAMKLALEAAGIAFLPGEDVAGPALIPFQKRKASRHGSPFRWIDATDLKQWADRRDAQGALPELISRLILSETGRPSNLLFPSGDSVNLSGWDGFCFVEGDVLCPFIPSGKSFWEFGTQKNIKKKANDDYEKRNADPDAVFVFVTPRNWAEEKKRQWLDERKAEAKWREVRAYDADSLVQWIERNPVVALWLARRIRKLPDQNILLLKEAWEEWSCATKPPLSYDLILAGPERDHEHIRILKWLRGEPSAYFLQAESSDEALSFLYASIQRLPQNFREPYESSCLVVTDNTTARVFVNSLDNLIIALVDADSGLIQRLVDRGHHVYAAYGPSTADSINSSSLRRLPRPIRYDMEKALLKMLGNKDDKKEAEDLARDSGRSLAVLRRLLQPSPARVMPEWADSKFSHSFVAALLAGAWNENSDRDREILEYLGNRKYDSMVEDFTPFLGRLNSPLCKVGNIWKISSPLDVWFLLAGCITSAEFERFREAIKRVFTSIDPRFDMEPDKRWWAGMGGIRPEYSRDLRRGLAESLILFSVYGERAGAIKDAASHINFVVRDILENADGKLWWSLSRDFQRLAEAAPDSFLGALEGQLKKEHSPIHSLFVSDEGLGGKEYLSNLLWALEMLAWDSTYLTPVAKCLAMLDKRDPGGNYTNRPKNSLRQIFLLWMPQTDATLAMRFASIDVLRNGGHADAAWKLMIGILPTSHDTSSYSPRYQWRQLPESRKEPITNSLIFRGIEELAGRLITDVGIDAERWEDLLGSLSNLPSPWRIKIIDLLIQTAPQIIDDTARQKLWDSLRNVLHHHREFPDAEWSLPEEELSRLEKAYHSLEPKDFASRSAWLFAPGFANLPSPVAGDWNANEKEAERLRIVTVEKLKNEFGIDAIFDFADKVQTPHWVGSALSKIPLVASESDLILRRALTGNDSVASIGFSLIFAVFDKKGKSWAEALLKKAVSENWGEIAIVRILLALPTSRWTWEHVQKLGAKIVESYWEKMNSFRVEGESKDIIWAIEKLLEFRRAFDALDIASRHMKSKQLPPQLMLRILDEMTKASAESLKGNDRVMLEHNVEKLFSYLYQARDVAENEIAVLEWAWLPLLKHSLKKPLILHKLLANDPSFFVDMICKMFRPEEGSNVKDISAEKPDEAAKIASRTYDLFHTWHRMPGGREDGTFDPTALEKWVSNARRLCAEAGRSKIGDQKIGEVLSLSPRDADGVWPIPVVRNIVEAVSSDDLETGISLGIYNRRGGTWRDVLDGGEQERKLAERYRRDAEHLQLEWPRTAALLRKLASKYDSEAKWHDEDVEKLQW